MAVYTHISDAELESFLSEYDLGAPLAFKGIAEGVSNSNFLLETEKGRFILTVYEARTDPAGLPYFLGLMRWLADAGYPSSAPVPGKDGEALRQVIGKPCAITDDSSATNGRRALIARATSAEKRSFTAPGASR